MNVQAQSLAGLVLHSESPARLAEFYRQTIGLSLEPAEHGTVGQHWEGMVGRTHVALWKRSEPFGVLVPVFRVESVDAAVAGLVARGLLPLHKTLDIGDGKRVATFRDPDGNAFRLIQLA